MCWGRLRSHLTVVGVKRGLIELVRLRSEQKENKKTKEKRKKKKVKNSSRIEPTSTKSHAIQSPCATKSGKKKTPTRLKRKKNVKNQETAMGENPRRIAGKRHLSLTRGVERPQELAILAQAESTNHPLNINGFQRKKRKTNSEKKEKIHSKGPCQGTTMQRTPDARGMEKRLANAVGRKRGRQEAHKNTYPHLKKLFPSALTEATVWWRVQML